MTPQQVAAEVTAKVAEEYRHRGYDVETEPNDASLPDFLRGFRPDLIARRPGDNVVVEVKVGTRTSVADRLRDVSERVNQQPGWRFSLVFANPDQPGDITDAAPAPLAILEHRVQDAERLLASGQREAAFVLLWSSAEGLLRRLGARALLPLASLPASALIRELYSAGELGREQFDDLMRLLPIRNQLVHGFRSDEPVETQQLRLLVNSLLTEVRNP